MWMLLAACRSAPVVHPEPECAAGKRLVNGRCEDYHPVCVQVNRGFRTYASEALASRDGGIKVSEGECCTSASDCTRRGRWLQRCVSKTDASDYLLEPHEDWFDCLTEANDVHCQCGGPNGAPTCQFTTFENSRFMECYSRHLPAPPPDLRRPPTSASPGQ